MTATLPAALLVLVLWWQHGRLEWRRDVAAAPSLGLSWAPRAAYSRAWVEHTLIGAQGRRLRPQPLLERCLVAGRAVWFYLGKLVWPANLIFIYPRWEIGCGGGFGPYLCPRSGCPGPARGELWMALSPPLPAAPLAVALLFVGTLFPVLGFFTVYAFVFSFVADHFQYLAEPGVMALAAAALALAWRRLPAGWRWTGPVGAAVLAVGLGGLTWNQGRSYRDSETLYRAIIDRNPDSWMAQDNLGTLLRQSGADLGGGGAAL